MNDEDLVDLPEGDFRRVRRYLAPSVFAWPGGDEARTYPLPSNLIDPEQWDSVMALPTDVALKSTSYNGAGIAALAGLHSDWVFSWPEPGEAPFMEEPSLLAGEEFDALVFIATHGYYRQAIGCLRNAIETLIVAAGLAVTGNGMLYKAWRQQGQQIGFGQARAWLRDSVEGRTIEAAAPESVFGDNAGSWTKATYARLCGYAHSNAGYNNADF